MNLIRNIHFCLKNLAYPIRCTHNILYRPDKKKFEVYSGKKKNYEIISKY